MANDDQALITELTKPDLAVPKLIKNWQGVGGGPVKTPMTPQEIQMMAMFMCPIDEIAAFYEFTQRQLYRRFAQEPELRMAFDQGRAAGRRMIRRKQFLRGVVDGDVAMLKWLGMNVLGQSTRHAIKSDNLDQVEMDDAVDAEFEEVFEKTKTMIKAIEDGNDGGEGGEVGTAPLGDVEGQGQGSEGDPPGS